MDIFSRAYAEEEARLAALHEAAMQTLKNRLERARRFVHEASIPKGFFLDLERGALRHVNAASRGRFFPVKVSKEGVLTFLSSVDHCSAVIPTKSVEYLNRAVAMGHLSQKNISTGNVNSWWNYIREGGAAEIIL